MSSYRFALFFHLLGVVLFFGGGILATVAFEAARRRERPRDVATLLGLAQRAVPLVGVGTLLIFVFGLWLTDASGEGFDEPWVSAALGLFILTAVLGALGGARPKRARLLAERLAGEDDRPSDDLRRALDDPLARGANYAAGILALVILALMVWQPGG